MNTRAKEITTALRPALLLLVVMTVLTGIL